MSEPSLNVFIVGGTGLIGSALLEMIGGGSKKTENPNGLDVVVAGYCNSKKGVKLVDGKEETTSWKGEVRFDDEFITSCAGGSGGPICIADCTASEDVSNKYPSWLANGWHVATPNRKCNSGPLERYNDCLLASRAGGGKWYVEATIGAGLPVVSTLRTLNATGDEIQGVQGIFSGTMSFLFNTWDGTSPFSEVVAKAKEAGYTEPDPRDDLNGMDVARKVVIVARESGLLISLEDVSVESLVPKALEGCSAEEFMAKFHENDARMADLATNAAADGNVLRFVGAVDLAAEPKKAEVKLAAFPKSHPFAGLSGADNILEIQSKRYGPAGSSTPLIIRGPGAGAQVTAAGVYGDIIALACSKL